MSSYEPYHVPQQSRRDKLRDQTSAGSLPLYDPHLLPSDLLIYASSPDLIKQEGPNFTESYVDPQSSVINNSFLYDPQSLRALQQSSSSSSFNEPLSNVYTTNCSVSQRQELSLSLSSQFQHQQLSRDFQVYGVGGGCGGPVANDLCISAVPLGPFTGYAAILTGSKFLRPAQQLLEELCQVGRQDTHAQKNILPVEDAPNFVDSPVEVSGGEREIKNSRLIIMLDEAYRRYKYYYQQMQAVVASFESVPGLRDAAPFANFALKAMSAHFKSLKNSITDQLQFVRKDQNYAKDATTEFGKSESYSHKQGNNLGFVEPVWRPQRGLPDRAVTVLRAWLFEHFLHPYPTDTDKQSLAKQTGLSRNQVSNWFINARVRLWKPMVEEIHMLDTRHTQNALEGEEQNVCKPSGHLSRGTASIASQNWATQTKRSQDLPSKRTRNEFADIPAGNGESQEMMSLPYGNMSHHQQFNVDSSKAGPIGLGGVSLTLGLHQNHGAQLSEPFPIKVARRFGLDEHSQGYIIGNSGVQNCQLGRDMVGGRYLHDFVG